MILKNKESKEVLKELSIEKRVELLENEVTCIYDEILHSNKKSVENDEEILKVVKQVKSEFEDMKRIIASFFIGCAIALTMFLFISRGGS